jgi:drug/metabolite transporter (DMT)-like permease
MDVVKGILLKIASALMFAAMSAMVRWVSTRVPVGEIVFFRSAFAVLPVLAIYAWRGELGATVHTSRPLGHLSRGLIGVVGMASSFAALARLPLAEVTAIGFAAPLITVALAALILHERVRIYRWSAVAIGLVGVLIMLSPHFDLHHAAALYGPGAALGALFALSSAVCSAGSTIQIRRLTGSETTSAIVFYFSLISALAGLVTLPFGWTLPDWTTLAILVGIGFLGGIGHLLLTVSFRLAPASVVAPFDYTTILWAFILGYAVFGEVPAPVVFAGAAAVIAAGLFVIWRERRLGLERARPNSSGNAGGP